MARILIIEDDVAVGDLLKEILQGHGYTVEVAGTADEAVDKLRNGAGFDLVTIDLVLPGGKSGLDVVAVVRTMRPEPKFLIVSGMIPQPVVEQLARLGVAESQILAKPFGIAGFTDKVRGQLMS